MPSDWKKAPVSGIGPPFALSVWSSPLPFGSGKRLGSDWEFPVADSKATVRSAANLLGCNVSLRWFLYAPLTPGPSKYTANQGNRYKFSILRKLY